MRKFALLSAAVFALGTMGFTSGAQAQGYGYRGGGYGGYESRGPVGRSYGDRGGRRGISTGAAVGLGIAGLAAGAIAADAARRNGYGYGAPAYDYDGY